MNPNATHQNGLTLLYPSNPTQNIEVHPDHLYSKSPSILTLTDSKNKKNNKASEDSNIHSVFLPVPSRGSAGVKKKNKQMNNNYNIQQ